MKRRSLIVAAATAPALTWNRSIFGQAKKRGAKPADLPIELPTTFEMTVNLNTAKALGLTLPPEIMVRATRVTQ